MSDQDPHELLDTHQTHETHDAHAPIAEPEEETPVRGGAYDGVMKVRTVPVEKIKRYGKNPRTNTGAVAKVAASLTKFGWRQPIVVDAEGVIIVGDTRFLAAVDLGYEQVPVHYAVDLSPADAKAYRLADNRVHEEAGWDDELLAGELEALEALGYDLELTGFDPDELEKLMADDEPGGGHIDVAPSLGGVEYQVIVSCPTEIDQAALVTELEARGLTCRLLTL